MNPDPRISAWLDENLPKLQSFGYKMEGIIDQACYAVGITQDELKWFRREIPRLCMLAKGAELLASSEDPDIAGVLKRILRKTAPEFQGCQRWTGSVQGGSKHRGKGGTPVVGFKGSTVPARRLLWNLQHEGTDQFLAPDQRLRNIQCHEASLCMNLAHWYKVIRPVDQGAVLAQVDASMLEDPEGSRGRLCAAGKHFIRSRIGSDGQQKRCPLCALDSRRERATVKTLSYAAGMALRAQLDQQH